MLSLMIASEITPGTVFQIAGDDSPMRVLLCDSKIVMYDAWWVHLDSWGLADLDASRHRSISYYLMPTSILLQKGTYLRSDPLSAEEQDLHRPDLPFSALRDKALTWSSADTSHISNAAPLDVSSIYLLPFGPSGGIKTGIRVEAENRISFSPHELFAKAQAIQAAQHGKVAPVAGVGIYRSGLQRGLPAFYLWGAVDRMTEHSTPR